MSNRIFVASICGAVGTGAFIGPKALEFSRLAAEELKLGWDPVPWQASRDRITELLTTMIMVGSSIIRIGQELFALQKSEVEELQEPHGTEQIGSSTMPQKRNPSMAEGLITTGLMLRGQINLAVEIMLIEHERDDGRWQMEFRLIPEIFMLLDAQLGTLVTLLNGLKVNREKMRANIQDEFAGEPIVKRLSEYIGRQRAHEILHRCFMQSHDEKRPILETLLADNTVKKYLSEDDLQRLFQPEHYLGASEEIVRLALADAGFAS
jgi:adenylosuccinate lyase